MQPNTYTNKSNANRAAKAALEKLVEQNPALLPTERSLQGESGAYFTEVYFDNGPADFNGADIELVGGAFKIIYDPQNPLPEANVDGSPGERTRTKPYEEWEKSDVETPVAVAWAVFDKMGADATRKDAVAAAIAKGVNKNTAGTQYRRWRLAKGLHPRTMRNLPTPPATGAA